MKTYNIYKSDYTPIVYSTLLNYLIFAKQCGHVSDYEAFENFSTITSTDTVYQDVQNLINH